MLAVKRRRKMLRPKMLTTLAGDFDIFSNKAIQCFAFIARARFAGCYYENSEDARCDHYRKAEINYHSGGWYCYVTQFRQFNLV